MGQKVRICLSLEEEVKRKAKDLSLRRGISISQLFEECFKREYKVWRTPTKPSNMLRLGAEFKEDRDPSQ